MVQGNQGVYGALKKSKTDDECWRIEDGEKMYLYD